MVICDALQCRRTFADNLSLHDVAAEIQARTAGRKPAATGEGLQLYQVHNVKDAQDDKEEGPSERDEEVAQVQDAHKSGRRSCVCTNRWRCLLLALGGYRQAGVRLEPSITTRPCTTCVQYTRMRMCGLCHQWSCATKCTTMKTYLHGGRIYTNSSNSTHT